jgi:predicted aspartyl protease
VSLVDSGATNNFISVKNAKHIGMQFVYTDTIAVRLADGQHVHTKAHCVANIQVGTLYLQQRFEIIDGEVATILGMPFLECINPHINWRKK